MADTATQTTPTTETPTVDASSTTTSAGKETTPASQAAVAHTPGGLPVLPLAVTAGNTTIGALSAAALAGGPLTAAAVAGTAAVVGALAVGAAHRKNDRKTPGSGGRSGTGSAGTGSMQRGGAGSRRGGGAGVGSSSLTRRGSGGGGARSGGGRSGLLHKSSSAAGGIPRQPRTGPAAGARSGPSLTKPSAGGSSAGSRSHRTSPSAGAGGRRSGGLSPRQALAGAGARANEVKALRKARQDSAPSRSERRRQDRADRRQAADARRADRAARRQARTENRGQGRAGRALSTASERMRQARTNAREKARAGWERRAEERRGRIAYARQRAAARMRLHRALFTSRLRYWGRCALAAIVAAPVGVLGLLTSPIGRKLGWSWLIHPGRRLYRLLADKALADRLDRDAAIYEHSATETDEDEALLAKVPRAPRNHTTASNTGDDMARSRRGPGFLFDEAASEMEDAAKKYDPDGMMHVLATIEGMPDALESIANTFAILAEKSDAEFPVEKEVGEALEEVYKHLRHAMDAAEDVGKVFHVVHEQDIKRHNDPRHGEAMWDTTNNDD
ncbi:hypothetical protein [Streptomyces sp. NPDC053560]|uniref:hypothetical protein n=1 Tax=Streptomyces sp. NPDC053560 TaxID=3365711 RepID=UPI0037D504C5